jgi:hypothetical protein
MSIVSTDDYHPFETVTLTRILDEHGESTDRVEVEGLRMNVEELQTHHIKPRRAQGANPYGHCCPIFSRPGSRSPPPCFPTDGYSWLEA